MPRGRGYKKPEEAKKDTIKAILRALYSKPEGMRFKELKKITGFHQSTLSARTKDLIISQHIEHDPINRVYRISQTGQQDLETRELLEVIEKSSRMILGSKGAASIYPDEDLIIKTSVAYSYPAIKASTLGHLKRIIHKYYMLHLVNDLAKNHRIDPRLLTGEKPLSELIEGLREKLVEGNQVIALSIDLGKVSELLNLDYLKEIQRIAKIEDEHGLQSTYDTRTGYIGLWNKYALQVRILEFIESHGRASKEQISELLGLDKTEAASILDELSATVPAGMEVFDNKGNWIKSITFGPDEMTVNISQGSTIKLNVKARSYLVKSTDEKGVYYLRASQ